MPDTELSLAPLTSGAGVYRILALDHRDAFRNAFRRAGVPDVSDEQMLEAKVRIVRALAPLATAVLLDPAAVPHCGREGAGLLVPLEEQGHKKEVGGRLNRLVSGGAARAADLGAHACKLLLYYRADHVATADRQLELVARAADASHRHGLPLVLEPLVYPLEGESTERYRESYGDLVVAGAERLAYSGADLLKLQFPGAESCSLLAAASSPLSWTLLGGSDVDGATFAGQLEVAARAGAVGFIAGRAIWSGALGLPAPEQEAWLEQEAAPLFARLCEIADGALR
ncbi:MAG: hypothetical protein MSC30_04290 [Gaiellaceae bacterium MAG52_C11]|nr:hypothetical protein [Candidatus Gaiellasilicea maunaloa]